MVVKAIKIQTETRLHAKPGSMPARPREAETQTSVEFKKAIPVHFIPKSSGTDITTQIEDGELFDFDTEVAPILEVLVGRTLETAFLELVEEAELREVREHREHFERIKHAEIVEAQRLEAAEMSKQAEKERRMNQERARLALTKIALAKTMSIKIAREVLADVCDVALGVLRRNGVFKDPVLVHIEQKYVPNLIAGAATHTQEQFRLNTAIIDRLFAPPPKPEYSTLALLARISRKIDDNNAQRDALIAKKAAFADAAVVDTALAALPDATVDATVINEREDSGNTSL